MAGQPTALLGEQRHFAVINHDRHAVFVNAGLCALLDHLVELGIAVDLPFLAVETQVLVLGSRIRILGLPLETEVNILGVERGLNLEIDRTILTLDRRRLKRPCHYQFGAELLFLSHVTLDTGLTTLYRFGALAIFAIFVIVAQPFCMRTGRINSVTVLAGSFAQSIVAGPRPTPVRLKRRPYQCKNPSMLFMRDLL